MPNSTRAAPFACLLLLDRCSYRPIQQQKGTRSLRKTLVLRRNDIPIPDTPIRQVCQDDRALRVPGDENSVHFMEVGHPLCVGLQVHVESAGRV